MKIKFFILILALAFFVGVLPVKAFEISPIKMLLTADPGTNQTVVLKVKNSEKNDAVFLFNVFGVNQNNSGTPLFERGVSQAESWVYPEDNKATIKKGETKSVNFIIKVPADASPGSYYLGLSAEPETGKQSAGSIGSRLVSLLTVQVSGVVQESVLIEKWEKIADSEDSKKWGFNLVIKNDGSVEVPMRGLVTFKNFKGDAVFAESIVVGNKLLAGSRRAIVSKMNITDRIVLPGLYQAHVTLNYGKTNQQVSATTYVWYFPVWSKVVAVFLALVIVGLLFMRLRKK